jgi:aliphatic sulfonates family ABC transporter substrate-binding protein
MSLSRRKFSQLAAAALVAVPAASQAQGAPGAIPVRIGLQAQTSWLLYTAKGLSLFEKAGLTPTFFKFTTGVQSIAAMQSRSIDIATPGVTPFAVGLAQGVNWKAIGIDTENHKAEGFLARGDTPIKTLADLRGKTVGVARGSTSYFGLIAALKKVGVSRSDVKLLLLGPPEQMAALQNKNVDAVAIWQPWIERMKTEAGARLIGMEADYEVYTAAAVAAVHGDYAKEQPEGVRRYLSAMIAAYDHIQKEGPGVAVKAMAEAMGITEQLATEIYKQTGAANPRRWVDPQHLFSLVPDGKFAGNLQAMADLMLEDKLIDKPAKVAAALDPTFIRAALGTKS